MVGADRARPRLKIGCAEGKNNRKLKGSRERVKLQVCATEAQRCFEGLLPSDMPIKSLIKHPVFFGCRGIETLADCREV